MTACRQGLRLLLRDQLDAGALEGRVSVHDDGDPHDAGL
jgi:hypothetical protein